MAAWKVPLADVVVSEEDIAAVVETYRSGWLSMGPRTQEVESAFAGYTGARHALAVASCTAGLHLMTLSLDLGPGDEVVVPSMTFVATVNAVAYTGATPVFADIGGLRTPWLTADSVEAVLSERTKAIMTMAYGGHPGETAEIAELARRRGVPLLEDAAHAAGARLGGRHLGTFGAAGAFSFFSNKNLAVGEGGMIVTDDGVLAERMRLLRSHGMTTLSWDRHRGHASSYDVVALGYNYRIDEPRAALALCRLARLDAENERRAGLDGTYRRALAELPGIEPTAPAPAGMQPAHHLMTVVLDADLDRDAFRSFMHEHGVQTSLHYPPVHHFSIYAREHGPLPNTDAYASAAVTLPLFAHMSEEQQEIVVETAAAALTGAAVAPAG